MPLPSADVGSSPRMRGAGVVDAIDLGRHGIIPAHAGSSRTFPAVPRSCRDHPRACGEQSISPDLMSLQSGSSPRMRGAEHTTPENRNNKRIIPAHAGSREYATARYHHAQDHPRACGEQSVLTLSSSVASGSSPRMRGAARMGHTCKSIERIIPAHAGSRART